jgi:thiol-disulfide isomerase/thioredoxin
LIIFSVLRLQVVRNRILTALLALGILGAIAVPKPLPAAERELAPDFQAFDSKGKKRKLSDFRGQVVLLNFWATWCAPCRVEIPWLKKIHHEFEADGFSVVGVAMDERGWRAVTPFLTEYGVDYPSLLGSPKIARSYGGLEVLPRTLFLDREGRIVASHNAILGEDQLRAIVQTLVAEGR